jgi:dipeptidyl aminopeptidase/acylaminoacyl peptidase
MLSGVFAGFLTTLTAYFLRMIISPPRQRLWATPADLGMEYDDVHFPARDGIRLSGWFVPAKKGDSEDPAEVDSPSPTLIIVHGWPWNRLGTTAETLLVDIPGSQPVQLIHLTKALHDIGYNILMFDLRNHGQSATAPPVTFGLREADDVLGALDFLTRHPDVNEKQIGAVGFATGANATLFALPRTDALCAVVAVQPSNPGTFTSRYAYDLLGLPGALALRLARGIYAAFSGLRVSAIDPTFAASGSGKTEVLYIQGTGDAWGSIEKVRHMANQTAGNSSPLFIETESCFHGYQYVVENPGILHSFFQKHMGF